MKRRLFWKILIGFWLTFIAIVEGVWFVFVLYGPMHKPLEAKFSERVARLQLASASSALAHGGPSALRAVTAAWPEAERRSLSVAPAAGTLGSPDSPDEGPDGGPAGEPEGGPQGGDAPPERFKPREADAPAGASQAAERDPYSDARWSHGKIVLTASDPAGVPYRLEYDVLAQLKRHRPPGPLNIPLEMVALSIVGGLLFSASLAWYLTRPIQRMRGGFERLAQGELDTRLQPGMGRRRDELADLARDFDLMAERLQQLIASKEQLLHDVSHELRSPLARLHLAVGLARQNPQRVQAALDRVERESGRLDQLVGELLTLSRAEAGAMQLDEYFDLESLVRAVANDARFEARSSGVRIEAGLDGRGASAGAMPTVRGNAELLRRALENVIRNALRHSASGDAIRVDVLADWDAGAFVISIADEGPGVAPEALETMFDPFVRAHATPTGQGFGLGLAIAKRAALAHGGSIEARNRPERGLVVTIRLPFGPVDAG